MFVRLCMARARTPVTSNAVDIEADLAVLRAEGPAYLPEPEVPGGVKHLPATFTPGGTIGFGRSVRWRSVTQVV